MFSIGDFARLGGVTARTLRYYEEVGLLEPGVVDPVNGYRSYSAHQLPRLHRIIALKELGLTLAQIAPLLDDVGADELRGMLVLKRAELQQEAEAAQARLDRVGRRLRHIEGAAMTLDDVIVKHVPAMRVAAVPVELPAFDTPDWDEAGLGLEAAFRHLGRTLAEAGVRWQGPFFSFYEEQPDGSLLGHAATEVGGDDLPDDPRLVARELPAVDAACYVHRGSPLHAAVGPLYERLHQWAEDHGYRTRAPGRDVLVDPTGDFVLELQLPVERT